MEIKYYMFKSYTNSFIVLSSVGTDILIRQMPDVNKIIFLVPSNGDFLVRPQKSTPKSPGQTQFSMTYALFTII